MTVATLADLMARFPESGRVDWIGLRPARRAQVEVVGRVRALAGAGLEGDRYSGRSGDRGVTLIQAEHLFAVGAMIGREAPAPAALRRNIVVSGINLIALRNRCFRLGEALLEMTGPCDPCRRMEEVLGYGGYNAMRGHGGITARVLESGWVTVNDHVVPG